MTFGSEWNYLSDFVKKTAFNAVESSRTNARMYFVKVLASDGYFANVVFEPSEKGTSPLLGIPILQSPYQSQPILPGDFGLLINVQQNIGSTLEGKISKKLGDTDYFVFLPLIKKKEYKGNPLKHRISSPDLKTFLELANNGLVIKVVMETDLNTNTLEVEAKKSAKIKTPKLTIDGDTTEINGETTINGNTTIEGETTINGANIAITSSAPMQVGDLATILNDLCSALSSFMTTPTAPGSPASAEPGFIAKITKIQSAVAKGFK